MPLSKDPQKRANSLANLEKNAHLGPEGRARAAAERREADEAAVERATEVLNAECEKRGPGALSEQVRQINGEIAQARWLREKQADTYLRKYGGGAAQSARRIETSIKLTKLIGDLLAAREEMIEVAIREGRAPNRGQPVQPRSDPMHVLRTTLLLLKQGAIPMSPGARALANELAMALEAELREAS